MRMRNAECGMRNAECGWDADCGLRIAKKTDTLVNPLHSAFRIPHSAFRLLLRRLVCGEIQGFIRAQQEDGALLDLQILAGE